MTDPVQMLIDAGAIPSSPFTGLSRYQGVPLALLTRRADQPPLAYVLRRFIPAPIQASGSVAPAARLIVPGGDRPDLLAARTLGEPLLYWRIADANAVVDPFELTDTPGRRVDIPQPPGS